MPRLRFGHLRLRRAAPTLPRDAEPPCNDLARFSTAQAEWLAARGLVFLTELVSGPGRFGAIVAASYAEACRIASRRQARERVLGVLSREFLHAGWPPEPPPPAFRPPAP